MIGGRDSDGFSGFLKNRLNFHLQDTYKGQKGTQMGGGSPLLNPGSPNTISRASKLLSVGKVSDGDDYSSYWELEDGEEGEDKSRLQGRMDSLISLSRSPPTSKMRGSMLQSEQKIVREKRRIMYRAQSTNYDEDAVFNKTIGSFKTHSSRSSEGIDLDELDGGAVGGMGLEDQSDESTFMMIKEVGDDENGGYEGFGSENNWIQQQQQMLLQEIDLGPTATDLDYNYLESALQQRKISMFDNQSQVSQLNHVESLIKAVQEKRKSLRPPSKEDSVSYPSPQSVQALHTVSRFGSRNQSRRNSRSINVGKGQNTTITINTAKREGGLDDNLTEVDKDNKEDEESEEDQFLDPQFLQLKQDKVVVPTPKRKNKKLLEESLYKMVNLNHQMKEFYPDDHDKLEQKVTEDRTLKKVLKIGQVLIKEHKQKIKLEKLGRFPPTDQNDSNNKRESEFEEFEDYNEYARKYEIEVLYLRKIKLRVSKLLYFYVT